MARQMAEYIITYSAKAVGPPTSFVSARKLLDCGELSGRGWPYAAHSFPSSVPPEPHFQAVPESALSRALKLVEPPPILCGWVCPPDGLLWPRAPVCCWPCCWPQLLRRQQRRPPRSALLASVFAHTIVTSRSLNFAGHYCATRPCRCTARSRTTGAYRPSTDALCSAAECSQLHGPHAHCSCPPLLACSYFYATLYLGTPAKKFAVIVDTGSTMTYVPCSNCGSGCGPNHAARGEAAFDPEVRRRQLEVLYDSNANCEDLKTWMYCLTSVACNQFAHMLAVPCRPRPPPLSSPVPAPSATVGHRAVAALRSNARTSAAMRSRAAAAAYC